MTKWILAAAVVFLLVVPSVAQAEPFTPELEADYQAALEWWGVSSPPQCASVTREVLPADPFVAVDGTQDAVMRATQPTPGESGLECRLYVFADRLAESAAVLGTATMCMREQFMRHEVGHLLGYGHSPDPSNIMYPSATPGECEGIMEEATVERINAILGPIREEEEAERLRVERQDRRRARMRRWVHHHHFGLFDATRAY